MEKEASISAIEGHSLAAWPAFESERAGGWVLRAAEGYSKRANSASALDRTPVPWEAAARFYGSRALPTLFRLSPLGRGAQDRLADLGFEPFEPSLVLTRALTGPLKAELPAELRLDVRPETAWLEGFAAAHGHAPSMPHARIVRAIALPAAFATLSVDGRSVAYGMAVAGNGLVGLFDIVTWPTFRRSGHGRGLVEGLIAWARGQGAELAYLQVVGANRAARALYDGLGFKTLYGYDYWKAAGDSSK